MYYFTRGFFCFSLTWYCSLTCYNTVIHTLAIIPLECEHAVLKSFGFFLVLLAYNCIGNNNVS